MDSTEHGLIFFSFFVFPRLDGGRVLAICMSDTREPLVSCFSVMVCRILRIPSFVEMAFRDLLLRLMGAIRVVFPSMVLGPSSIIT